MKCVVLEEKKGIKDKESHHYMSHHLPQWGSFIGEGPRSLNAKFTHFSRLFGEFGSKNICFEVSSSILRKLFGRSAEVCDRRVARSGFDTGARIALSSFQKHLCLTRNFSSFWITRDICFANWVTKTEKANWVTKTEKANWVTKTEKANWVTKTKKDQIKTKLARQNWPVGNRHRYRRGKNVFDSWSGQIAHSVTNGSPPLRRFFGAALSRR